MCAMLYYVLIYALYLLMIDLWFEKYLCITSLCPFFNTCNYYACFGSSSSASSRQYVARHGADEEALHRQPLAGEHHGEPQGTWSRDYWVFLLGLARYVGARRGEPTSPRTNSPRVLAFRVNINYINLNFWLQVPGGA